VEQIAQTDFHEPRKQNPITESQNDSTNFDICSVSLWLWTLSLPSV